MKKIEVDGGCRESGLWRRQILLVTGNAQLVNVPELPNFVFLATDSRNDGIKTLFSRSLVAA